MPTTVGVVEQATVNVLNGILFSGSKEKENFCGLRLEFKAAEPEARLPHSGLLFSLTIDFGCGGRSKLAIGMDLTNESTNNYDATPL